MPYIGCVWWSRWCHFTWALGWSGAGNGTTVQLAKFFGWYYLHVLDLIVGGRWLVFECARAFPDPTQYKYYTPFVCWQGFRSCIYSRLYRITYRITYRKFLLLLLSSSSTSYGSVLCAHRLTQSIVLSCFFSLYVSYICSTLSPASTRTYFLTFQLMDIPFCFPWQCMCCGSMAVVLEKQRKTTFHFVYNEAFHI